MATLIGDGGHAFDIRCTLDPAIWNGWVEHHTKPIYDNEVIIGINDPQVRSTVADELDIKDLAWVHPNAYIGPKCKYGYGTHINYGVTMTRTTIGHHCTISPGVTICGDVTIGDRVFVGAGAVIKNLVTIGSDAFIRMGSIVTRDIEAGERF